MWGVMAWCVVASVPVVGGVAPQRSWTVVDGNRVLSAVDVGRQNAQGLMEVELRWDGQHAPAWVGRGVMVQAPVDTDWTALGLRHVRQLMPSLDLQLVEDAAGALALDTAERLQGNAALRAVTPDFSFRRKTAAFENPPNDPRYGGQWYLNRVAMTEAWAINSGSDAVTVVVVDNGCDMTHPDLVAKMDPGKDVVDNDDDPSFQPGGNGNNHGTSCAGLVAASTNNSVGIAGACPGCRLRCVRLLSDSGMTPASADVAAYQFALEVNADVISNSWGFVDAIPVPAMLAQALENVFDNGRNGRGAMVLFAAGNDDRRLGNNELEAVRGVICVGAINNYDEATSYTNYGDAVDLVAPTGTLSTDIAGAAGQDPGDYTNSFGGTSSACPVAAGIAGLLVSAAPDKTSQELSEILIHTTRPAPYASPDAQGHDATYGYGVIAPAHALRQALGLPEPVDGGSSSSSSSSSSTGGSGGDAPPDSRQGCAGCAAAGVDAGMWGGLLLLLARRKARQDAAGTRR